MAGTTLVFRCGKTGFGSVAPIERMCELKKLVQTLLKKQPKNLQRAASRRANDKTPGIVDFKNLLDPFSKPLSKSLLINLLIKRDSFPGDVQLLWLMFLENTDLVRKC